MERRLKNKQRKHFDIIRNGEQRLPFVLNSPHSGCHYPQYFLSSSRLSWFDIRSSEDAFVDELFMPLHQFGVPFLCAHFPRAYLDVNREPYELDPRMFSSPLPSYANTRSLRVAGGLGTIARIVAENKEIYRWPLDVCEGLERIEAIYKPYHAALRYLLGCCCIRFGYVVLIDCHSMPSTVHGMEREKAVDFIIGDRYGTSCDSILRDTLVQALCALGYRVMLNKPYAGGFITEQYGHPQRGLNALQIEVNRKLYMDETCLCKHDGFTVLQRDIVQALQTVFALHSDYYMNEGKIAAE